ncbi:MAG: hypothetical protein WAU75_17640 [Solirubrobacteraceae bacterium]
MTALARRQHGHVARCQLLALGVSQGLIAGRLGAGDWVAIHKGVYCIGPRRDDPISRAAAAVLACGDGAALSHSSAATLWGLEARWSFPLEVTAKGRRDRPGITAHRCQSLTRRDVTHEQGIPITTRARTILDMAPRLSTKALTRLVNDARRAGHLHPATFQDILQRNPYHPATKLLTPFAEDPVNPTRSTFEDEFLAFIKTYNLPPPQVNVHVNGREVDALFPAHKLIVEADGWEFHRDREAFEDDRERDAENLRHGIATVRVTRDRIGHTPDREAARLNEILDRLKG